jgi:hypothetical protein
VVGVSATCSALKYWERMKTAGRVVERSTWRPWGPRRLCQSSDDEFVKDSTRLIGVAASWSLMSPAVVPPLAQMGTRLSCKHLRNIAMIQFFTIKMAEGIVATSYASGQKFFIDPMKLLPLERFLPKPKGAPGGLSGGGGRGGGRGKWSVA